LTCQKEFLLFYMCQLWALHVSYTKRQFFTLISVTVNIDTGVHYVVDDMACINKSCHY